MKSITNQVEEYVDSITAIIFLANGTVPRITVGTADALSLLSAISLKIPVKNICSILTNLSSVLYQNFPGSSIPDILKSAPQLILNNPVALQRKYLQLRNAQYMKQRRVEMRKTVKAGEEKALEMLVDLFDWLDGLKQQPTTETVPLCAMSWNIMATILDPLARMVELLRRVKEKVWV
jgi:hypothetical protein